MFSPRHRAAFDQSVRDQTNASHVRTYSAAIWSSSDDVVLEFQIRVEDGGVYLRLAVELVTHPLPVSCWLRHFGYMHMSWCDLHIEGRIRMHVKGDA